MTKNNNNKNKKKNGNNKSKNTMIMVPKKAIKGRGDYDMVDLNSINHIDNRLRKLENGGAGVNALATLAGGALGSMVGAPELGAAGGSAMAKYFGFGDYTLKQNSLIEGFNNSTGATFMKNGRGDRIIHREFVTDIISSSTVNAFSNALFPVNPAMAVTFPWLSAVAVNYEQYEPHGIVFEFISTSGAFNGTSQALGTVIMASDYDPSDPPYPTKIEMESSDYSNSAKTASSQIHGVECAREERGDRVLLCRSGAQNDSLKFYDLASFQIATTGLGTANVVVGELWVSYDISFYKKQLTQGQIGNTISISTLFTTTGLSTSNYFGTANIKAGTLAIVYGTNTITFPNNIVTGRYLLTMVLNATGAALPLIGFTTNCAIAPASYAPTLAPNPFGNAGGSVSTLHEFITITGPSAVLTLTGGTYTAASSVYITITQVPFSNLQVY